MRWASASAATFAETPPRRASCGRRTPTRDTRDPSRRCSSARRSRPRRSRRSPRRVLPRSRTRPWSTASRRCRTGAWPASAQALPASRAAMRSRRSPRSAAPCSREATSPPCRRPRAAEARSRRPISRRSSATRPSSSRRSARPSTTRSRHSPRFPATGSLWAATSPRSTGRTSPAWWCSTPRQARSIRASRDA